MKNMTMKDIMKSYMISWGTKVPDVVAVLIAVQVRLSAAAAAGIRSHGPTQARGPARNLTRMAYWFHDDSDDDGCAAELEPSAPVSHRTAAAAYRHSVTSLELRVF
jgi:hypothetical protein